MGPGPTVSERVRGGGGLGRFSPGWACWAGSGWAGSGWVGPVRLVFPFFLVLLYFSFSVFCFALYKLNFKPFGIIYF